MAYVTNNGAVVTTSDAVDTNNVVYLGGIAIRKSDGAMHVTSGLTTAQLAAIAPVVLAAGMGSAAANAAAIQALADPLEGIGGRILLPQGLFYSNAIALPSGGARGKTILEVPAGCLLVRADSQNRPLVQNRYAPDVVVATQVTRASNVVTVTAANSLFRVGQQILVISGNAGAGTSSNGFDATFFGASYRGYLATILTVSATNFTYAQTGSDANASSSNKDFVTFVPIKTSLASSAFSYSAGIVTVTEIAHGRKVGQIMWMGSADNAIAGYTGVVEVNRVINADSWTFKTTAVANPTASTTFRICEDHDIAIVGGGILNGNRANNTSATWAPNISLTYFSPISGLEISCGMMNTGLRLVNAGPCVDVDIRSNPLSGDTQVAYQFEGGSKRTKVWGSGSNSVPFASTGGWGVGDDLVAYTIGKWEASSQYNNALCPLGPWAQGHTKARVRDVMCASALNMVKIAGNTGYPFNDIVVDGCSNSQGTSDTGNMIWIHDDGPNFVGTTVGTLTAKSCSWTSAASGSVGIRVENAGTSDKITVENCEFEDVQGLAVRLVSGATVKSLVFRDMNYKNNALYINKRLYAAESGSTLGNVLITGSNLVLGNGTSSGGLLFDHSGTVSRLTITDSVLEGISAGVGYLGNLGASSTIIHNNVSTATNTPGTLYYGTSASAVLNLQFNLCNITVPYIFNSDATLTSTTNELHATASKFTVTLNVLQDTSATWSIYASGGSSVSGGGWFRTSASSALYKLYGNDIALDPIAVSANIHSANGQYITSTQATIEGGPAVKSAAGWVALGTGAAGINTVIT